MASARKDRRPGDDQATPRAVPGGEPGASRVNGTRAAAESSDKAKAARLRALKQQIADGTYKPDPHEIAREIIKRGL